MSFKRAAESCAKDEVKIVWHEPKKTLMLRDVDNVVSEEEIQETICAEAGDDVGQIEVPIKKPEQGAKSRKTYAMVAERHRSSKKRSGFGWAGRSSGQGPWRGQRSASAGKNLGT
jgi:hypothetical protein